MKFALMLGGNIGPVEENFNFAASELHRYGVRHIRRSFIFRSAPVDCVPGTPDFSDQALTGEWDGTPEELFGFCQQLEHRCGRGPNHSSRESRTLDIDFILWGEETLNTPLLQIPHPRAVQRRFVLEPLAAIAGEWKFPGGQSVAELLKQLP